jgi:hypothetical protein
MFVRHYTNSWFILLQCFLRHSMDPFRTNDEIVTANTYGHLMKGFYFSWCSVRWRYLIALQIEDMTAFSRSLFFFRHLGFAGFLTMSGCRLLFHWTIKRTGGELERNSSYECSECNAAVRKIILCGSIGNIMCYVIYRFECNGYICYDSTFTRCESSVSNDKIEC